MPSNKQESTQTQQVSQSTSVTVQNVIEGPKLEPLQRLQLLADIFSKIDAQEQSKYKGPETVLQVTQVPGAAFLAQPQFILMATAAVAAIVLISKRVK